MLARGPGAPAHSLTLDTRSHTAHSHEVPFTHCTLHAHTPSVSQNDGRCRGARSWTKRTETSRTTLAAPPQAARRAARPFHPGGGWARTGTGAGAGGRPQAGRPARWARRRGRARGATDAARPRARRGRGGRQFHALISRPLCTVASDVRDDVRRPPTSGAGDRQKQAYASARVDRVVATGTRSAPMTYQ